MAEIDKSQIGVWGPEATMHVELGKIREFARAVKDDKAVYREGTMAPPTFLMTLALWIGDMGQTRTAVKLDYRRLLKSEHQPDYLKSTSAADVRERKVSTKDVFEKAGKRGRKMLFIIG